MHSSGSAGSSVEGEKIHLSTRQFKTPMPILCPRTKRRKYRFRLSIHGTALIEESYTTPKNTVEFETSLTNVGDKIHGTTVSGWALKALGRPNVEILTGTHSGTVLRVSGGCFAEVEIPPREYLDSPEISARNPPVIQRFRTIECKPEP